MITYNYSFNALKSLEAFLKTAYENINIDLDDDCLTCGCLEITYKHGYDVRMFYLGSTHCDLGKMSVEQIASLIYILIQNKQPFLIRNNDK